MWYYKITFTLPHGNLTIVDNGDLSSMLKSEFIYSGIRTEKGITLNLK